MTSRVAVIGGGLSGLACAGALHARGVRVTVFDKGRGVGGRTSARRDGSWHFDHGAPRLDLAAVGEPRVSWETAGVIAPWQPRGADRKTWIGVPGSNALALHLATGLDVQTGTRVVSLVRRDAWWLDAAGIPTSSGPFDVVVITTPTPQVLALLATTTADALVGALSEATFVPCLVAMIAIEAIGELDELREDSGPLASAYRFDGRPGRSASPGVGLWTAHGSETWSAARVEDDPQDAARELAEAMTKHVPGRVIHLRGHRWRYARAATRISAPYVYDDDLQLGVAGDGFEPRGPAPATSRAVLSGLALATRILDGV